MPSRPGHSFPMTFVALVAAPVLSGMYPACTQSFSGLHLEVHENVGVLVDGDLVALRTIMTGTHTGDYAGVAATRSQIQTSASHIFRVRDDELVEHWPVVDTYRILVAIGAIPPGCQRVPADPGSRRIARRVVPGTARY